MEDIPSQYSRGTRHKVVIAFTPVHWNRAFDPHSEYSFLPLQSLRMWICGPRSLTGCPVGARTLNPCSHVMYALYALGVVAHNPAAYSSKWHRTAYLDLGQDPNFTDDFLREVFQ